MRRGYFRKPSIRKRIAARTSWKRYVRHSLGLKAPRGWGWLTNPRRAAYNRMYYRTSKGCLIFLALGLIPIVVIASGIIAMARHTLVFTSH
jgi:hypothetical protein